MPTGARPRWIGLDRAGGLAPGVGLLILLGAVTACRPGSAPDREAPGLDRSAMRSPPTRTEAPVLAPATACAQSSSAPPAAHVPAPLRRCFPEDVALGPLRPLGEILDRAASQYDAGEFSGSLACAEEAARLEPRSVEAHHARASALQALDRTRDAETAFMRALALDPNDPETLAGAAELYVDGLDPTADRTEIGLELARRGSLRARTGRYRSNKELRIRLAVLEAQALNALGRSREALSRAEGALSVDPAHVGARAERATALFELSRFPEAREALEQILKGSPEDAWAHNQLGLVLERLGDEASASREQARARALSPEEYHAPVPISEEHFRQLVLEEIHRLPDPLRADLAQVKLETAEMPDLEDLTSEEPPLSPTILGLFRGSPLGDPEACGERSIVLYRRNLQRSVASQAELVAQVRTTLLHELGHLRGEDDNELRDRGLE